MYDRNLRETGIEAPQFALLMTLESSGPCSQGELGQIHALDKTTVSRNLKLLERSGWVAAAVGGDRRERLLSLTATGREKLSAAKKQWKKAQDRLRAGMSQEQWDEMFRVFRMVSETIRTE
jgi:DNA-binding MarR family transcriptional regulator